MTLHELMLAAHANPQLVLALLGGPPVVAAGLQLAPAVRSQRGGLPVAWSTVVYAACVPGIFSIIMIGYLALVQRANLMNLDVLATFGPIASMVATLMLAGRKCTIGELPGIDRLGGMLMMIAATVVALIVIEKLRIVVFFTGSVWTLLGLGVVLFLVFRYGMSRLVGGGGRREAHYD